jgi:hypothetical protein
MPLEQLRFIELQSRLLGPSDVIFNESWRFNVVGWGLRGGGFIAIPDASRAWSEQAIDQTFCAHSWTLAVTRLHPAHQRIKYYRESDRRIGS